MPILRMPEVKAEFGHRSHASVYKGVRDGLVTVPVPIGQRAVGWPDTEVKAINAARIAGKSDDEIRALVDKLHQARMAGTGETFKTDWFDRSKAQKQQIAQRKGHSKVASITTGAAH